MKGADTPIALAAGTSRLGGTPPMARAPERPIPQDAQDRRAAATDMGTY
jgi:hypothetical protein